MPPGGQREGFTLLEVLVGALIAVVILSALLLLLHTVASVREDQAVREEGPGRLVILQDEMAEELRHLVTGGSNDCAWTVAPGRLDFCSLQGEPWPEVVALAYRLNRDGDLERGWNPPGRPGSTNVVATGLEAFQPQVGRAGEWRDRHGGAGTPPALVRLRMRLADDPRTVEKTVFIPGSIEVRSTLERR